MNFLAHLFLSPPGEDALLGSLLGDFIKGPLDQRYAPAVMRAIALHRRLDTFTDAHPAVRASKARISAHRRRYAGIMIDVFYDHFLARYWREFHPQPLGSFTADVYAMLHRRESELPERLRAMAPYMIRDDWLSSYAEVAAIDSALNRMARRLTRENRLADSAEELTANYAALESDFRVFLPQVQCFASDAFESLRREI